MDLGFYVVIDRSKCLSKSRLDGVGNLLLDSGVAQEMKDAIKAGAVVTLGMFGEFVQLKISKVPDVPPETAKPGWTCGQDASAWQGPGRKDSGPQEVAASCDKSGGGYVPLPRPIYVVDANTTEVSPGDLKAICDMTVELTRLRMGSIAHFSVEDFAPDLFARLLRAFGDRLNPPLRQIEV